MALEARVLTEVGLRLKAEREYLGLTQADLAKRVGVDPSYIAHLENGRKSFNLDMLVHVCWHLDVEPQEVIGGPKEWALWM